MYSEFLTEIAITMGDAIHPDSFDLIVLGTGLQESLIAAAASTSGLSVLQIDSESDYGSHWIGLTGDKFLRWAEEQQRPAAPSTPNPAEEEGAEQSQASSIELPICPPALQLYRNVRVDKRDEPTNLRQRTIDLAPNVLYTCGPMTDALVRCKADSYLTFRLLKSCVWREGKAVSVPSSRADVFKDKALSLSDKRTFMRFLKAAVEALKGEGPLKERFGDRPFIELLREENLPEPLQAVALYCLAALDQKQHTAEKYAPVSSEEDSQRMQPSTSLTEAAKEGEPPEESDSAVPDAPTTSGHTVSAAVALKNLGWYVDSVSRFGGPYMLPDYGSGELPQAFCRTAAVNGAIYVLRREIRSITLDRASRQCQAVTTATGQVLKCRALAGHCNLLPKEFSSDDSSSEIARAVVLLRGPLLDFANEASEPRDKDHQMLLTVPPGAVEEGVPENPVRLLQLGAQSCMAPQGRWILHLTTLDSSGKGQSDLKAVLEHVRDAQQVQLSVMYSQKSGIKPRESSLPGNVVLCEPPDESLGFARAIDGARSSFLKLFPDRQFLPEIPRIESNYDSE